MTRYAAWLSWQVKKRLFPSQMRLTCLGEEQDTLVSGQRGKQASCGILAGLWVQKNKTHGLPQVFVSHSFSGHPKQKSFECLRQGSQEAGADGLPPQAVTQWWLKANDKSPTSSQSCFREYGKSPYKVISNSKVTFKSTIYILVIERTRRSWVRDPLHLQFQRKCRVKLQNVLKGNNRDFISIILPSSS